jgi:DNA-binding CsgD family transcriptional regulator
MRRSRSCVSLKLASTQISPSERIAIRSCPAKTLTDDVQKLDPLRPWLAHAFRRSLPESGPQEVRASVTGRPVLSGQMVLTADAKVIYQTRDTRHLLAYFDQRTIEARYRSSDPYRLPAPVLKLLQAIAGAANGTSNTPPRMRISTAYGVLTLEAKWLVPAGTLSADAARDPKSCLISVTIDLHEHPIAHAARVLRESGATPTQVKVGVQLVLGKPKPMIADELGVQLSSVADLTKRLYQTLDVHNSTELATKIWLDQRQVEAAPPQVRR